jgi:hypothetical protein
MLHGAKYAGGCHCGAIRYEVATTLDKVISCNCSICSKRGTLLAFAPTASFDLKSGDDTLSDYQFNKHIIHHHFCATCGVASFARGRGPDGAEMVAINVRCLDGIDLDTLSIHKFDGASL